MVSGLGQPFPGVAWGIDAKNLEKGDRDVQWYGQLSEVRSCHTLKFFAYLHSSADPPPQSRRRQGPQEYLQLEWQQEATGGATVCAGPCPAWQPTAFPPLCQHGKGSHNHKHLLLGLCQPEPDVRRAMSTLWSAHMLG